MRLIILTIFFWLFPYETTLVSSRLVGISSKYKLDPGTGRLYMGRKPGGAQDFDEDDEDEWEEEDW